MIIGKDPEVFKIKSEIRFSFRTYTICVKFFAQQPNAFLNQTFYATFTTYLSFQKEKNIRRVLFVSQIYAYQNAVHDFTVRKKLVILQRINLKNRGSGPVNNNLQNLSVFM